MNTHTYPRPRPAPGWKSMTTNDRIIGTNNKKLTRSSSQSLTVPSVRSIPKAQLPVEEPVEEQMASPDLRHRPIPRVLAVDSKEESASWKATQSTGRPPASFSAAASGSAARAMLVIFMMDGGCGCYYYVAANGPVYCPMDWTWLGWWVIVVVWRACYARCFSFLSACLNDGKFWKAAAGRVM